jgi:hypothetical protein
MPKIFDKTVKAVKKKSSVGNPYAVATASLQKAGILKKGTRKLTKKGQTANAKAGTTKKK